VEEKITKNLLEALEKEPLYLAYRLVEEGKIDPWDVDIELLLKTYLEEIKKIELQDLRVPARVIAFATYLLKKQLELFFPNPPKKRKKRKLTLKEIADEFKKLPTEELVEQTIKRVRKIKRTTKGTREKRKIQQEEKPPLHRAKLEEVLQQLLELIERLQPRQKISFYQIAGKNDYVAKLWGLLNLSFEGKIELEQPSEGDIYFFKP
jgi:segregation and condensation protein A